MSEATVCEGCLRHDEAINAEQFPVLRLKANGPTGYNVQEISLDGVPLRDVVSLRLDMDADSMTVATIVMEVTPDIEIAGVEVTTDVRRA